MNVPELLANKIHLQSPWSTKTNSSQEAFKVFTQISHAQSYFVPYMDSIQRAFDDKTWNKIHNKSSNALFDK